MMKEIIVEAHTDTTDGTYIVGEGNAKVGIRLYSSHNDAELVIHVRDGGFFEVSMRSCGRDGVYNDREIVAGNLAQCWIYGNDGHSPVYV